eukprot:3882510-Pyramimonas_sp.AAC.1
MLDGLASARGLDIFAPANGWGHMKTLMIEAARQTRDGLQGLPRRSDDNKATRGSQHYNAQDARQAAPLAADTEDDE